MDGRHNGFSRAHFLKICCNNNNYYDYKNKTTISMCLYVLEKKSDALVGRVYNLPHIGNRGHALILFCNKTQVSTLVGICMKATLRAN
jgi:hypothetical protein